MTPDSAKTYPNLQKPYKSRASGVTPWRGLLVVAAMSLVGGCGGEESPVGSIKDDANEDELSEDDNGTPETDDSDPSEPEDVDSDVDGEPAASPAEAWLGDGTDDGAQLVEVYKAPTQFFCSAGTCRQGNAVDLEFNPARPGELWVLFRQPYDGQLCEETDQGSLGCQLMPSKVAIVSDADGDNPRPVVKQDGNAWHFMRVATSLAFADDDSFATVGEVRTGNFMDDPLDFMGPTWWSSDPDIFAVEFGRNGSHLDMLHGTPFGMGIAHDPTRWVVDPEADEPEYETRPIFWAFNGQSGSIDRYDFKRPHEPGGANHSDGTLHRYVSGEVLRTGGVPSHMEFANLGWTNEANFFGSAEVDDRGRNVDWALYISDTGNSRIVRMRTTGGRDLRGISTADDQIADAREMGGIELEEVVPSGVLGLPSGLAIAGEVLFVGDVETSRIHAFDLEGESLVTWDTGLPPGSLAGLAIGPDQKLYVADWLAGAAYRVEVEP